MIGVLAALSMTTTEGFAGDQYQIIPFRSLDNPRTFEDTYAALVFNETTGDVFSCRVSYVTSLLKIGEMSCVKDKIRVGSVPPGPAVLAPSQGAHLLGMNASFWKVDQNGHVTFCGGLADLDSVPQDFVCASAQLP